MKTIAVFLFLAASLAAQTASVGASGDGQTPTVTFTLLSKSTVSLAWTAATASATPGGSISLALTSSTTRLEPASLQFTISAPSASVSGFTVTAGAAATAAAKTVTCAVPTNPVPPAGTTQLNCIVAAVNTTPIGNGIVANVVAAVPATAPAGSAAITVSNYSTSNVWGGAIVANITTPAVAVTVQPALTLNCAADPNVLSPAAYQIEPGEQVSCTVTLSAAAASATTVTLSSSQTASPGVSVPASISIPAGSTTGTFVATGT